MCLAHFLAAKAVDGGHAQQQPGLFYTLPGLNDAGGIKALVKLFQHGIVAAFQPHIHNAQPQLAQGLQLFGGFAQNAVGRAIHAHALAGGNALANAGKDLHQRFGGQDQGVAVRQKHAAEAIGGSLLDILKHLAQRADRELFGLVHIAKGAAVVAAAQRYLQNQAVGFTGRAENISGIVHKNSFWCGKLLS